MKQSLRFIFALMVTVLLVLPGVNAAIPAQAAPDTCFGLNQSDCALVNAAFTGDAMRKLSSFTQDFSVSLKTTGSTAANAIDFKADGKGPVALTSDAIGQLLGGNFGSLPVAQLVAQNTLSASLSTGSVNTAGTLEIRIVNGVLYYQGDKVTNGEWRSIDLKTMGQRRTIRSLGSGMNILQLAQAALALRRLEATSGLIKAARIADLTIDNQPIAQIVYTVNLSLLFKSPDIEPLLRVVLQSGGNKVSNDQLKQISANLASTFQNATFSITRLIGTTDKLSHGIGVDLSGKFAAKGVLALAGGGAPNTTETAPLDLTAHFLVTLSSVGSPVSVSAPANAKPFDLGPLEPTAVATAGS